MIARFDGGCFPNPGGHASCAMLIERDGFEIARESRYLGCGAKMTSNVAEYEGLMMVLRWLKAHPAPCTVITDSMIIVRRMNGTARKHPMGVCAAIACEAVALAKTLHPRPEFRWKSRSQNGECDAMCDLEIAEAKRGSLRDAMW
jgi:ribonuclease HI